MSSAQSHIEMYISVSNVNAQVETFLRTLGVIKNKEDVVDLTLHWDRMVPDAVTQEQVIPVSFTTRKEQEVRLTTYNG